VVPVAPVTEISAAFADGVPLEERGWWPTAVGLAASWLALVQVVLWWLDRFPVPRTLWGDENGYLDSALKLLAGDPGWWLEPLWPPLYSQFLAGLLWIGGGSLTVVVLVQSGLLIATAVLLGDLTRRVCGSRAAGMAVVVLTLGYPPLVAFSHYLWPEVLHLFLFSALLWLMAVRGESRAWCAVAGVALGLALLSKSLLMPFVPVLFVAMVWGSRLGPGVLRVGLVLGMAALTVAPTVIANAKRTGTPMIANSARFNIWVGLNDVGRENFRHDVVWPEYQRWEASAGSYAARDRILQTRIREFVRDRGWVAVVRNQASKQYFRFFHAGCYLTDQLPGGAAQELANAGYLGAGPVVGRAVKSATVASILLLFAVVPAGLILGGCRSNRWVRSLILFLVFNLVLFMWLHVKTRYRIQMLPAAFVGIGCLVAWIEAGFRPRPSVASSVAAGLVVVVLMWFALG
jgi:4-amino-4-deoxy-L-arabinose transferase-like glycosyltransferase